MRLNALTVSGRSVKRREMIRGAPHSESGFLTVPKIAI